MKKFNEKKSGVIKCANTILMLLLKKREKLSGSLHIDSCKRILVIDFDAIGDIVMLIPFLRVLRKCSPKAKIVLVCRPHARDVLSNQGLVDSFFCYDQRWFSSVKSVIKDVINAERMLPKIRGEQFDLALEPRGDLRDIFFMHFCNADRKVAYTYTGGEYMLTDPILPDPAIKHLIDDKMYFLKQLGCEYSDEECIPRIYLTKDDIKDNEEYRSINRLAGKYVIGIHPGASKDIKRWKKFPELILKLNKTVPDVVFLLFSEEYELGFDVNQISREGICYRHICGDISEYIRRIALCDVVICNDSSAAHIAGALGVDVHVIFGPVLSELARPYSAASVSVYEQKGLECRPCSQGKCHYANKCLEQISVDEVYDGVIKGIPKV